MLRPGRNGREKDVREKFQIFDLSEHMNSHDNLNFRY